MFYEIQYYCIGQNSTFLQNSINTNQQQRHLYRENMHGSQNFLSGWGGGASRLLNLFYSLHRWLYYTFSKGGSNFLQGGGRGSNCSIETHITITCDFTGGGGVWNPYPPSRFAHGQCGILARIGSNEPCGLLLSLETANANRSIVFKRLAKALIRLRICAGWSKPLVLAHTTLLEISYWGPLIGAKYALRLYIRTKLHLSQKEPVISFIKNM